LLLSGGIGISIGLVFVLQLSFLSFLLGGFFSDDVGHVAENCKQCPNGSFVSFDKAPGKQAQDCKSCPHGK